MHLSDAILFVQLWGHVEWDGWCLFAPLHPGGGHRVSEMKQEMPSPLLVIHVIVLTWTCMYDDLWCFYCTKKHQGYPYGLTAFHATILSCVFWKVRWKFWVWKSDARLFSRAYLWVPCQQQKVLSKEASRNSCRKLCCSSLQGSLPPCWGTMCLPSWVHLVTSKAVPQKAPLCPRDKTAAHFHPESFDRAAVSRSIRCFVSIAFGFPSRSMAWPRAGWMEGWSRQLPPRAAPAGFSGISLLIIRCFFSPLPDY